MTILTTHIGSLPRPDDLMALLRDQDAGRPSDPAAFDARVRAAVDDIVRAQVATGLDIVNDGEQGKVDYSTYVKAASPGSRVRRQPCRWRRPQGLPGVRGADTHC